MEQLDLTDNWRIATVMELLESASRVSDPKEVLPTVVPRFGRLWHTHLHVSLSVRDLEPGQYKITRLIDRRDGPTLMGDRRLTTDPWREWNSIPVRTGGFLGSIIASPSPKVAHHLGLSHDPVMGDRLRGLGSCMAVPLFDGGQVLNWSVMFREDPRGFSADDVERSLLSGNFVGTLTRNLLVLRQVRDLNETLTAQLEQVAQVQRSLLPQRTPQIPGLQVATSYLTSDQAGGDYYDFFGFPDGTWGVVIADVSGHGPAAATVMAMLHAILHIYVGEGRSPADVMRAANQRLLDTQLDGGFVTAFYAVFDPATGDFTYSRAGHNPPRHKDGATGRVRPIDDAATIPLGLLDSFDPTTATIRLRPGDTVVLYTDGITEAFNDQREMFGAAGLDRALEACTGEPDCTVDSLHAALYRHTGHRTRDDDQTLVALRFTGP